MADSTCTMLSIQEKRALPIPISSSSSTMDKELDELLKSRNRLTQSTSSSSLQSRLDQFLSYFNSLSKIKPRYTVALERSGLESIPFSWQDCFKPSKNYTHTSINSEKMVVVFNIAAVYSQMAVKRNCETKEELKEACKAYQSSAAALRFFRERFGGGESVDVSKECVSMVERLMLAQAQECCFRNTVLSDMSHSTCSKAARQVEIYYEQIHVALASAPLNRHIDKSWIVHVQLKTSLFSAESGYHYAIHLHNEGEIGEEIARLKMGIERLKNAKKSIKGASSSSLMGAMSTLEKIMILSLDKAESENSTIYYLRVPSESSLSDLPAFVLKIPEQLESLVALSEL